MRASIYVNRPDGVMGHYALGEQHFQHTVSEYVAHYHHERNHQGLGHNLIDGLVTARCQGRIRRRSRLGGLLNYYERAAWRGRPST